MKNKITILFLVIMTVSIASAANIGVSPARIDFDGILRSGYAERPLIVTIDAEEDISATISTRGEISSWLAFSKSELEVSKGNPEQLIVSVSPPSDIPNGNYTGFLTIKSDSLAQGTEGFATGIIVPTLDVYIVVEITDEEVVSCQATNFKVSSAEEGDDIIFSMDIINNGNVRLSPKITLDIWDDELTSIIKEEDSLGQEIAPTKKDTIRVSLPSKGLDLGQYWVDVSAVDCYSTQTLTFDILEEGALQAFGTLDRITSIVWAEIDDIIPITVTFTNSGEKPLEARFKGQINFQNKIIQLLESDEPTFVPIDETENMIFYFTPRKSGKYVISGRVFYDSKRTYEETTIVNIKPNPFTFKSIIKVIAYIILIVIITALIIKIRKERKRLKSGKRFRL